MNKNKNLKILNKMCQEYELLMLKYVKQFFNVKILTLKTLIKNLTNFFHLLTFFFYQKFQVFSVPGKNYIFTKKFEFFDQKRAKKTP